MTEQEFTDLLMRYELGQCTKEEKNRLERWLDAMESEEEPFTNESEREGLKNKLKLSIYQEAGISSQSPARKLVFSPWLMVAASVAVLLVMGWFLMDKSGHEIWSAAPEMAFVESGDKVEKLHLPDGSIVWLKPRSSFSYPLHFEASMREVTLDGEALFEVEKNPVWPFKIHCGDLITTVLGTSFNIKKSEEQTEVVVLTGRVMVTAANEKERVELLPNEGVVYARSTQQFQKIEEKILVQQKEVYIQDTQYNMHFQKAKVSEIVKHVENKFNVSITIKGSIGDCLVTADFTDQSLVNTLEMISEALNAVYKIESEKVILEGNSCE